MSFFPSVGEIRASRGLWKRRSGRVRDDLARLLDVERVEVGADVGLHVLDHGADVGDVLLRLVDRGRLLRHASQRAYSPRRQESI